MLQKRRVFSKACGWNGVKIAVPYAAGEGSPLSRRGRLKVILALKGEQVPLRTSPAFHWSKLHVHRVHVHPPVFLPLDSFSLVWWRHGSLKNKWMSTNFVQISRWGDIHYEASASREDCKKHSGLKERQNIFVERQRNPGSQTLLVLVPWDLFELSSLSTLETEAIVLFFFSMSSWEGGYAPQK